MEPITKQAVLEAFKRHKVLSFEDFSKKDTFESITDEDERNIQLRRIIANLVEEGIIRLLDGVWPTWEYNLLDYADSNKAKQNKSRNNDSMTLYQFLQLSQGRQRAIVFSEGAVVANRISGDEELTLFQLHSFYVEVTLNRKVKTKTLRSFLNTDSSLLEPYLEKIDISWLVS